MLRPVGGLDEEVTGVLPAVEPVAPATFRLPGREDLGDFASGWLLRDAARLSTRAAAGPFRSFGRIAVEPRPYQLVPLMLALELDPVRLLVADDVGIGKTVEACLIARELLDRGEIRRIAVLCPPHLAEQWQRELAEKFHLEAELVLSSTIQRLERAGGTLHRALRSAPAGGRNPPRAHEPGGRGPCELDPGSGPRPGVPRRHRTRGLPLRGDRHLRRERTDDPAGRALPDTTW